MSRTDPAYDEYLSTGIDPTNGELEEKPLYPRRKFYTVWYFHFRGDREKLIDIFEKYRVPYGFNDDMPFEPNYIVVESPEEGPHPVFEAMKNSNLDITGVGYERTHRLVYQRAYKSVFGEQPEA